MSRPRVWLIPYLRDWSYDFNARAIAEQLGDRYEFRIAYKGFPGAELRSWRPDLAVDFWWKGHARRLLPPEVPVLKQVSSHRWEHERFGTLDVSTLIVKHLSCEGVIVPSRRLQLELAAAPRVHLAPKGFDPKLFGYTRKRTGSLSIGWAGNASAPDKRVEILRAAAPYLRTADRRLAREEMSAFYNRIDVITVASDAEGDPLPLIEGMACGCFPVVTNVGIVPELVRHGDNGLIVAQSVEAFAAAFEWCRANRQHVRDAGRRNALELRESRTWGHIAPAWAAAFDAAISSRK